MAALKSVCSANTSSAFDNSLYDVQKVPPNEGFSTAAPGMHYHFCSLAVEYVTLARLREEAHQMSRIPPWYFEAYFAYFSS